MRGWRSVQVGALSGLLVAALLTGCSGDDDDSAGSASGDEADATTTTVEEAGVPGAEWAVETPEEHDIDPALLEQARAYAFAPEMNTQGVVVVHEGVIVAEWYTDGANDDSWAASWSMAKSFTSALVGIAIEDGLIPGVDEPMTTWFPEWAGTDREGITLRDVLQMSSGLDWVEAYDPAAINESDIIQMVIGQEDQLGFAAGQPAAVEPGIRWNYSSGDTMLLSGVLEQATGMPVHDYAQQEIFEPIGMEQADWWQDARGHTLTYCCLDTSSRGFARFGLLYLHDGAWGDEQIVPTGWVTDSLEPTEDFEGYGYQWWLDPTEGAPDDTYAALGHDGQYIYVIPSLDLVVVRNGTYAKDPGDSVAAPNLFAKYPSDGLAPGRGTAPPAETWDEADFLGPIVEAVSAE